MLSPAERHRDHGSRGLGAYGERGRLAPNLIRSVSVSEHQLHKPLALSPAAGRLPTAADSGGRTATSIPQMGVRSECSCGRAAQSHALGRWRPLDGGMRVHPRSHGASGRRWITVYRSQRAGYCTQMEDPFLRVVGHRVAYTEHQTPSEASWTDSARRKVLKRAQAPAQRLHRDAPRSRP